MFIFCHKKKSPEELPSQESRDYIREKIVCLGTDGRDRMGCDRRPGVICHTYARRVTGGKQLTHNRPWSCVCVIRKRPTESPRHPTPLKHANVPVLCSNWSQ